MKLFLQAKTFTKNNNSFGKAFLLKKRFVIKGSKVLIMGLTYKENVPDTRESSVKEMIKVLKDFGVDVYGYDPLLTKEEIEGFGVKARDNLNAKVDCVITAVGHDEFRRMGLEDLIGRMNSKPVLIDVRGLFDGEETKRKGFYYKEL
uniref:UDP-N-acetyl-D-mannosamine dehydrogenase n=1 Tax=Candidatus Methanophaga sp. ANME-1 ERB7 TaxID=2759913 RepID=A0A7G9ZAH6_9EURY|nr:UDP-N-acetyl-D-mannosamine dehydrogenase [Methanosarcinales archaeon ANME-1 ERB7]